MKRGVISLLAAVYGLLLPVLCLANPSGANVVHGNVSLSGLGTNSLTVNQSSSRAIINWQDFSIQPGETTTIMQPSVDSVILNRIVSGNPSAIYGSLLSNGGVFLLNPFGVLVGAGGVVDVGGTFTASSLDITNEDFLNGDKLTLTWINHEPVTNEGTISSSSGDIFLIGPSVSNSGNLSAPNGTVGLAAGDAVVIEETGDERVFVQSSGGTVGHAGNINANIAEIKALGSGSTPVINVDGLVQARSIAQSGGKIYLRGGSGVISVTAPVEIVNDTNATDTDLQVEAGAINVTGSGVLNTSSNGSSPTPIGGGTTPIGGGGTTIGGGTLIPIGGGTTIGGNTGITPIDVNPVVPTTPSRPQGPVSVVETRVSTSVGPTIVENVEVSVPVGGGRQGLAPHFNQSPRLAGETQVSSPEATNQALPTNQVQATAQPVDLPPSSSSSEAVSSIKGLFDPTGSRNFIESRIK